ncbi:MAG: hypothetical protein ACLTQH_01885 [Fusobacterium sp.]
MSAISNSLLENREYGYIIFGVKDKTWEIVGTNKNYLNIKLEIKMYFYIFLY